MKHLLAVIAVALALVMGSNAMARDGDGRRHDRGHSFGNDFRGGRHFDRRVDDRRFFDRKFDDRRFDRRFVERRFVDRRFDDRRSFDRRFFDRRFDRRFDDRFFFRDRFRDRRFNDRFVFRSFHRGDRLPRVFLSTRFVVNDFGRFRLYRPPRGYHWVRVERDAFLVGLTTGIILGVATDRFF